MFNFNELLVKSRTEIMSGVIISIGKVELYNGNKVSVNGAIYKNDIGKSVKLLKDGSEYTIINFSNKRNTKNKVFIV